MFRRIPSPLTAVGTIATLGLAAVAVGSTPAATPDRGDSVASASYSTSRISAQFADATLLSTQRPTLRGAVSPGAGRLMTLQKYYNSAWRTVGEVKSAADGHFS